MEQLLIRCSSLHKIMGKDPNKLTETAKSYLIELAKENLFGYSSFDGNKYTEKGNLLEDKAIQLSGLKRGRVYKKNAIRLENGFLTGECDVFDDKRNLIIDTKCSWDIGTHPFFDDEAEKKAKKSGYDIQMQGYMWLWDCDKAEIDFCLFQTPEELLSPYDDFNNHITKVDQIPQEKRITTVTIERDEKLIENIQTQIATARKYYDEITAKYRI